MGPIGPRIWTRCRLSIHDIPPLLYRVHHPAAHTFLESRGFTACAPDPRLATYGDPRLTELFNCAFDKESTQLSPFVQLYTDFHAANRMAYSLEEGDPEASVEIWVVDGTKLALSYLPVPVCFLASTLERGVMGLVRESVESRRGDVLVIASVIGVPAECLVECIRKGDVRRAKREGWVEEAEVEEDEEERRDIGREIDRILGELEMEEEARKAVAQLFDEQ